MLCLDEGNRRLDAQMTSDDELVKPAPLKIEQSVLDDLRHRLASTRWPEDETVDDWSQGVPLDALRGLCAYWLDTYDWRRCETLLNRWNPNRSVVDGLGIHFLHIRSPVAAALPMIMTHGWPGSLIEFHRCIGPLTNPVAHGGKAEDAFHVVVPSLPGFGFSDKPSDTGWTVDRIADAWTTLMRRLGYKRWVAQGGDWGAFVSAAIGVAAPPGCSGIHLNMLGIAPRPGDENDPTPDAKRAMALSKQFAAEESGYSKVQRTRPQTIGYALTDSPAGQAAWIYEKLKAWSDPSRPPEATFGLDAILDNVMMYWLPRAATSSARLYWESLDEADLSRPISLPVGISLFPHDASTTPRHWAERVFSNIVHWREVEAGGHFGAFEQPEIFVREVRDAFRGLRQSGD